MIFFIVLTIKKNLQTKFEWNNNEKTKQDKSIIFVEKICLFVSVEECVQRSQIQILISFI